MDKAPEAFRIISEVATELDVPQHVLRFWESRFNQIRPMKRGGGRRYYRPDDIDLLRGIRHLLYGEGYTIRGVQRLLREQGVGFVQTVWQAESTEDSPGEVNGVSRSERPSARDRLLLGLLPKFSRPKSAEEAAVLDVTEEDAADLAADDILNVDSGDDAETEPSTQSVEAASAPARLPREQIRELQSALDELGECRRLIDAALSTND
ncbi:MAG: MerR family transcriptional regulator [Xanthobacteraceae bacterium]